MCLENGRLNVIDLKQMQAAFFSLQWVGRLFQAQALGKWSHIPEHIFSPFRDKYLCFFLSLKSRAFKGFQMITSHFWNAVLKTWLTLEQSRPFYACVNFVMEQQPSTKCPHVYGLDYWKNTVCKRQ